MRRLQILVGALVLAGSLAACGSDAPRAASRPRPAPAQKAPEKKAEAAAEVPGEQDALIAEYSYSPVGKRDPFRSFFDTFEPVVQSSDRERNCGPICQWELDQLRLVAVVSGVANPLAMLEDPDGRGHNVRRGSAIGKREGKVTDIRRDKVIVTELLRNQQGQVLPVQTEILLRSEKGARDDAGNQMVDLSMAR